MPSLPLSTSLDLPLLLRLVTEALGQEGERGFPLHTYCTTCERARAQGSLLLSPFSFGEKVARE